MRRRDDDEHGLHLDRGEHRGGRDASSSTSAAARSRRARRPSQRPGDRDRDVAGRRRRRRWRSTGTRKRTSWPPGGRRATSTDGDMVVSTNAFFLEVHLLEGDDHFDAQEQAVRGCSSSVRSFVTGGDGSECSRGGGGPGRDRRWPRQRPAGRRRRRRHARGGPGRRLPGGGRRCRRGRRRPGSDSLIGSDGDDQLFGRTTRRTQASVVERVPTRLCRRGNGPNADRRRERHDGHRPAAAVGDDRLHVRRCDEACDRDDRRHRAGDARRRGWSGALRRAPSRWRCHDENTDTITVTMCQRLGRAAHDRSVRRSLAHRGRSAESTGVSEIDSRSRSATPRISSVVSGGDGPDTISLGTNGISFTTDAELGRRRPRSP